MRLVWYALYFLGLALSVAGVLCALIAYTRTFRLHGRTPLFPKLARLGRSVRGFFARFLPLLHRDGVLHAMTGTATASSGASMTLRVIRAIPRDGPVELQITALIDAVAELRQDLAAETASRSAAALDVASRVDELSQGFAQALDRLDAKLYDIGVDGLRLQVLGVALVVPGTVLLAVLSLMPPSAA